MAFVTCVHEGFDVPLYRVGGRATRASECVSVGPYPLVGNCSTSNSWDHGHAHIKQFGS